MEENYNKNVFINCPYDDEFVPYKQTIIFAVIACGFNPLLVSFDTNGGVPRIEKIKKMIDSAKLGIHDLSRCKSTEAEEWYRLNMAFELGLDLGSKHFSERHNKKNVLVLQVKPFTHLPSLSDYSGFDPKCYDKDFKKLLFVIRDFIYCELPISDRENFITKPDLLNLNLQFQKDVYAYSSGCPKELDGMADLEYKDIVCKFMRNIENSKP